VATVTCKHNHTTAMTTTIRCAGPNRPAQVASLGGTGSTLSQFTYAAGGNLTPGGRQNYTREAENRLVELTARTGAGPQTSLPLDYDWPGRRLRQPVRNDPTGSGNPTHDAQCVNDGGILLARTDHAVLHTSQPSLAHAYYHCDGSGNVTCLINTNGQVVARYSYDPYGNLLGMSGPLAGVNTYRFSSKEWGTLTPGFITTDTDSTSRICNGG